MKKTLLATAIAGALAASGAQAATVYNQDGTKLDLYGNLQLAYAATESDVSEDGEERQISTTDGIVDNGSTLGVAGEHVIYDGLTGYFKYEFEGDADEIKGAGGLDTGDQAYFGLKGNFGDARIGSWDPLIDDWIQDPITNNEFFDVSDSNSRIVGVETREGDKVSYMSPSFGGLQFALGTQYEGDAEFDGDASTSAETNNGGSISVGDEEDSNASFFGGVKYTAGAFSIAAVYDNLDNNDGTFTATEADGTETSGDFDAGDQYGITTQYTIDTLRLALKLERFESDNDYLADTNFYGVSARYGYGMGDIYAAYQYVDVGGGEFIDTADDAFTSGDWPNEDENESYNEVIVGANYNISDAMYVWSEVAMYDRADDEDDGVAVGATYLF